MAYSSEQRAISHRDWSRKKAPISRVGSYDFNGTVDRATMKMHMAAADRQTVSSSPRVLTLWPLSSSAIDKTECFAVREREVLWTMRAGQGMGRTTDGRMKALSSLNYFRLVLKDWQVSQLKAVMGMSNDSENDAMDALKAVVGDKRMEHPKGRTFKIDELNKIDEHLRHYVLANIQYAGVVITGEEPGSRQSLQGIAVTVGGLNTLANNGDKTLCPGMKLCMTVPRCVPDSTQWPAPCDHIGLPHGKVTPILRQADAQDLTQTILGGTNHIHTQVARMMSGCGGYAGAGADEMKECKPARDVYFAFVHAGDQAPKGMDSNGQFTADASMNPNELDVMRRINDAVVLTMDNEATTMDMTGNIRMQNTSTYAPAMEVDTNLVFDAGGALDNADKQLLPTVDQINPMWRLVMIAFGNVRNVVTARVASALGEDAIIQRRFKKNTTLVNSNFDFIFKDGTQDVFDKLYNNQVPDCLSAAKNNIENALDPDARHYAAMITDVMRNVAAKLEANKITLKKYNPGTAARFDASGNMLRAARTGTVKAVLKPCHVEYHRMQAVSNGNAAFALGKLGNVAPGENKLGEDDRMQPNIVVMDAHDQLPWEVPSIHDIVKGGATNRHATSTIVFRKNFHAPMRCDPDGKQHIELSDNELPFVGAWIALEDNSGTTDDTAVPYRSNYVPDRFLVHKDGTIKYYYLTWSGFVHLVCHNVLRKSNNGKLILELRRAELVISPHYAFDTDKMEPTLRPKADRKFGAPGLGSYLQAILEPDTDTKNNTQYQDYLRKHSPIASLVNSVIRATVEAVTQHQLATDKKTVGMALSSAGRGEAVDVVLTGAV